MAKDFGSEPDLQSDQVYQLLEEIQLSQPADADVVRSRRATRITGTVVITPGNVCDRAAFVAEASVRELQRSGVSCTCRVPVPVGSIFHLRFDDPLNLAPAFAICERCSMLGETTFDVRLRFLQEVELRRERGDEPVS